MVSEADSDGRRARHTQGGVSAYFTGLFAAWRRLLTRLVDAPAVHSGRSADTGARRVPRPTIAFLRDPAGAIRTLGTAGLVRLRRSGTIALLLGAIAIGSLTWWQGALWAASLIAAMWMLLWGFVRLFVLRAASPPSARGGQLDGAWGGGLLPYAFAWLPVLRVIAFVLSAWLTYRGLQGADVSPRRARRMIAAAFGGQALVEATAWALGASVVLLV